jgi:hypothetical protein
MIKIKNSANHEQRFDLLENVHILSGILQEVTQYEKSLITDLDPEKNTTRRSQSTPNLKSKCP